MKAIRIVCKAIDTFTEWTGRVFAFLSLLTLGVIILEVFMRRVMNQPQIWTMDMIVMSFGCYVILISAFGFLKKSFVCVDVIYALIPGLARHILHIVTYLIFLVPFAFELIPVTYSFFLRAYTTHELGYSVWQPVTWPVRLALFLGVVFLAIQGISEILKHVDWVIAYFRNGRKDPQIDEGPSAAEAVLLDNGGHLITRDPGDSPSSEDGKEAR